MRKVVIISVAAMTLAGCQTARQDRALTGGVIGGATGAAIGGIAGGTAGAAVAGGLLGAAAGAIIGANAPGPRCYAWTRSGRRVRVRC
jgi:hypothetical protein